MADYTTTGIVTAPVDLKGVADLLNSSGSGTPAWPDDESVCTSGRVIAIFAASKPMTSLPVGSGKLVLLSKEERAKCMWGLSLYTEEKVGYATFVNNVTTIVNGTTGTDEQRKNGLITYDRKPTGGVDSPYRQSDFIAPDITAGYNKSYVANGSSDDYVTHESLSITYPYCSFPSSTGGTGYFWDCATSDTSFSMSGLTATEVTNILANPPLRKIDIGSLVIWWQKFLVYLGKSTAMMHRFVRYQGSSADIYALVGENGDTADSVKMNDVAEYTDGSTSIDVSSIEFYSDAASVSALKTGSHTYFYIPYSYAKSTLKVSHSITKTAAWDFNLTEGWEGLWVTFKLVSEISDIKYFKDLYDASGQRCFEICWSYTSLTSSKTLTDGWEVVSAFPSLSDRESLATDNTGNRIFSIAKYHSTNGITSNEFNNETAGVDLITNATAHDADFYVYLHYKIANSTDTRMNSKEFDKYYKYTIPASS